jgi:hypothetical protein
MNCSGAVANRDDTANAQGEEIVEHESRTLKVPSTLAWSHADTPVLSLKLAYTY